MENTILSFAKLEAVEQIRDSIKHFDRVLFELLLSRKANSKAVLFLHRLYFSPYYLSKVDKRGTWQHFHYKDRVTKIYQILVKRGSNN